MFNFWVWSILPLAVFIGGRFGLPGRSQPIQSAQWVQGQRSDSPVYAPGEVLVKFKKNVTQARIQEINTKLGTEVVQYLEAIDVYQLKIVDQSGVEEIVGRYSQLPDVEYAEPNYTMRALPKEP
jgi:hypothetical protein